MSHKETLPNIMTKKDLLRGSAQGRSHVVQSQNPAGWERQGDNVKMLKGKTTNQEMKDRDDSPRQMKAEGVH